MFRIGPIPGVDVVREQTRMNLNDLPPSLSTAGRVHGGTGDSGDDPVEYYHLALKA